MRTYIAIFAMLASMAQAATWERPAGGYTPTNHSVNTTKYQIDRSNGVAISSVKVDGDINKAFEGLNSLESRVAPNVVGQSGKFLSNNGADTFWGLISTTSISSGAATAGQVLKANGAGTGIFGLLDTSSFPNNGTAGTYTAPTITFNAAGFATAVTATQNISITNLNVSSSMVVSGTSTLSGSLNVRGPVVVSGSVSVSGALNVSGTIANPAVAKAWVSFNGSGGATILSSYNVSSVTRSSTGVYTINFATPMGDSNYAVVAMTQQTGSASWATSVTRASGSVTIANRGTGSFADTDNVSLVVFGN